MRLDRTDSLLINQVDLGTTESQLKKKINILYHLLNSVYLCVYTCSFNNRFFSFSNELYLYTLLNFKDISGVTKLFQREFYSIQSLYHLENILGRQVAITILAFLHVSHPLFIFITKKNAHTQGFYFYKHLLSLFIVPESELLRSCP